MRFPPAKAQSLPRRLAPLRAEAPHSRVGQASGDLAEARSHRLAGRLHDAPGAGGDAAEVLAEVGRRLDVTAGRAALVREAVAEALEGRRPRW